MAVFRVERNKGYTVMSNHHLRNKELSLKAKGLLSQMLSLPEDWDYTLAGLSFINREKIDAIREAVKELERAGYIVRSRERDEKGRLRGTDYVIFEQPQTPPVSDLPTLENPTLDNPTLEKPTQKKPTLENPTQLNKDIQKTNLPKKEKSNIDLSSTDSIPIHSLNPLPYDGEAATPPERKRKEATDAYSVYEEIIKDNIEYDHFVRYGQVDKDRLDEIVSIILETVCSKRKTIRIAGDDYPAELVKAKFMNLIAWNFRSNVSFKVSVNGCCTTKPATPTRKSGVAEQRKCRFPTLPCMRNDSFIRLISIFKTKKPSRAISRQERKSRRSCCLKQSALCRKKKGKLSCCTISRA